MTKKRMGRNMQVHMQQRTIKGSEYSALTFFPCLDTLGGALAAMVMARLQMPLHGEDPLMQDEDERNEIQDISRKPNGVHHNNSDNATRGWTAEEAPRTVWDEMLARFSADSDLIVLRDAYSVASPKLGDSGFAATFGRNHAQFCRQSAYKPAYWRLVADKDIGKFRFDGKTSPIQP